MKRLAAKNVLVLALLACASTAACGSAEVHEDAVDRSTPRRAYAGFTAACADGAFARALSYLDLIATPHDLAESDELARELCDVVDRETRVDPRSLADRSDAGPAIIATLVVGEAQIPLELDRSSSPGERDVWRFSRETVAAIPKLDAAFGSGIAHHVPDFLRGPIVFALAPWQWIGLVVLSLVAIVIGRVFAGLVVWMLSRRSPSTPVTFGDHVAPTL